MNARKLAFALCHLPMAIVLLFAGCATGADGKQHLTAEGKQILRAVGGVVLQTAVVAGTSAANQYATGGPVDGGKVAAAAINGAAFGLRTLAPQTVTADGINHALATFSGDPRLAAQLAPTVNASIQTAIVSGLPPARALENAAVQLNHAAAVVEEKQKVEATP